MNRLTTNKPTSEMNMIELAHNGCYAEERLARYRDFDRDIDARDFARELMVSYGLWKSCEEYGLDADNELVDDEIFDETMLDNMQYDATTIEGLVALFYRNLWAMADLHSKLKHYEDLEGAGRLIEQKYGYWKERSDYNDYTFAECSECGFTMDNYLVVDIGNTSDTYVGVKWNYCPKCGTKMVLKAKLEEIQKGE